MWNPVNVELRSIAMFFLWNSEDRRFYAKKITEITRLKGYKPSNYICC